MGQAFAAAGIWARLPESAGGGSALALAAEPRERSEAGPRAPEDEAALLGLLRGGREAARRALAAEEVGFSAEASRMEEMAWRDPESAAALWRLRLLEPWEAEDDDPGMVMVGEAERASAESAEEIARRLGLALREIAARMFPGGFELGTRVFAKGEDSDPAFGEELGQLGRALALRAPGGEEPWSEE